MSLLNVRHFLDPKAIKAFKYHPLMNTLPVLNGGLDINRLLTVLSRALVRKLSSSIW
jgi:hypothetical protein